MGGIILVFALSGFFLGKVLVETLKPEPIVAAQIGATGPMGQGIDTGRIPNPKSLGMERPGSLTCLPWSPIWTNPVPHATCAWP